MSLDVLSSAGILLIRTFSAPGDHFPLAVMGMHGAGVGVPIAAEVAATTIGFALLLHIPKGMTLTIGMLSSMVAAGILFVMTLFMGRSMNKVVPGASPSEHFNVA